MQHVKDTLAHPGCARAALKYYSGLRSFQSLRVMFSRCNVPALQVAGLLDGCMGAGVRRCALISVTMVWLNCSAQVFAGAERGFSDKYELIQIGGGHFPHIERQQELSSILSVWLLSG